MGLLFDQGVDLLFDRSAANELVDQHVAALADAERPVGRLILDGRVPPAVEMYYVLGGGQVQAGPAGLQRQDEKGGAVLALELVDELFAARHRRAAVEHQSGAAENRRQEAHQRLGNLAKLREDQRLFLARRDLLAEFGQAGELAALIGIEAPVAQELARVVAQLLESHQVGQHDAAPLDVVEPAERLAQFLDQLGVEGGLTRTEPAEGPDLGLLRQVGDHALVGLEPPENIGLD